MLHLQVMQNYLGFHCSIYFSVELIVLEDNLWEHCYNFTLKGFKLNSFGENVLLRGEL